MKKFLLLLAMVLLIVGCTQAGTEKMVTVSKEGEVDGDLMKVHFLNVGQGDSIFIQSPNGKTMLIDGGVKGEGKQIVEYLRSQGVKKLNYVVATHPDADHIGGLISVLNSISIDYFVDSGKVHTSQTYEEMITLVDQKNIDFIVPAIGDTLKFDDAVQVDVLYADETADDNNDASIVLKLTYNDVSFLLTGDAGVHVEKMMMDNVDVKATVLKAGHHGSNTSSSTEFLQAVKPEVAVLSYGQDNKYGHPHYEVTSALQQIGSKIYGTAESGHIIVETDGKKYNVNANEWTGIGATSSITPPPAKSGKVEIVYKNNVEERVTIQNNSAEPVALQDWKLISVAGNQTYTFPNVTLQPGKELTIVSGPDAASSKGVLEWTKRAIWLNDESDKAQLVNPKGEVVSEFE